MRKNHAAFQIQCKYVNQSLNIVKSGEKYRNGFFKGTDEVLKTYTQNIDDNNCGSNSKMPVKRKNPKCRRF